nr:hypothetical protein [Tanacetum cinerariifolium]
MSPDKVGGDRRIFGKASGSGSWQRRNRVVGHRLPAQNERTEPVELGGATAEDTGVSSSYMDPGDYIHSYEHFRAMF